MNRTDEPGTGNGHGKRACETGTGQAEAIDTGRELSVSTFIVLTDNRRSGAVRCMFTPLVGTMGGDIALSAVGHLCMLPTISAVVHTYNSEKYLAACLESLQSQWIQEIVVCDMHSTDATQAICQRFGVRLLLHEKIPLVEPARPVAIAATTGDWVLVLDSDEMAPAALIECLAERIRQPEPADAYHIPVQNIIWGKPLRAAYPDYHVRFFRKACFNEWPPYVHRGAAVGGVHAWLPAKNHTYAIRHHSYSDITGFIAKMNHYTTFEVEKYLQKGVRYHPVVALLRAKAEFGKRYLLKAGFLDGVHGLHFALLMAFYKYVALLKLWDATRKP
ncbi:MAG: glycosyltransferase family 2 protein [Candidatus Melainabacteria bacterium]|nr:glycosyltransferase family 2 protein [Candidatus Melainabacteria bacterium]